MERLINLPQEEMPRSWYNILPDLPVDMPPSKDHPDAKCKIADLSRIMLKTGIKYESSTRRWIRMPEDVRDGYMFIGRPRPLHRAFNLEKELKTPARIYLKREDLAPTGSHKMSHALPQAYFAAEEGFERVATETGAVQWGPAMAYCANMYGVSCTVYVVRSAYNYKHDRVAFIRLVGGEPFASPTNRTEVGKKFLKENPEHPGSLGIAVAESAEDSLKNEDTAFPCGSLLNHVLLYATINGLETKKQLELVEEEPDMMIGCFGGGSNFGGFIMPFVGDVIKKKLECRFVAVQGGIERLSRGEYRYDFLDEGKVLPQMKNLTMGPATKVPLIYAEGLRYPASSPLISLLVNQGIVESSFYPPEREKEVLEAGLMCLRKEGFLPAPESDYAIRTGIDEALKAKERDEEKVILINVSGHGYLDFRAYREGVYEGKPASETMKVT